MMISENVYKLCRHPDCKGDHHAFGYCVQHYYRFKNKSLMDRAFKRKKIKCKVDGCSRNNWAKGFCRLHYQRWRKYGDPLKQLHPVFRYLPAKRKIQIRDLHWVAGFLEGEGCFSAVNTTCRVSAYQNEREPLQRLCDIFGGRIYSIKNRKCLTWFISSARAEGVMMTLAILMSARRFQQIKNALKKTHNSIRRGIVGYIPKTEQ